MHMRRTSKANFRGAQALEYPGFDKKIPKRVEMRYAEADVVTACTYCSDYFFRPSGRCLSTGQTEIQPEVPAGVLFRVSPFWQLSFGFM